MPDKGQGRVHRFRDHVVAGVNWRPTRFVDEVPPSRVCGLCRMIPKRMVLLPCSHALCQSCHAASFEGVVGQCPLDQVQFEEPECFGYDFPTRTTKTLKVHCWNEAHGCEYTGTMERMLEHYENECTFHTVECLRCGEGVQHSDLPTHYVAGCIAGVSSTIAGYPSSDPTALTLEDVSAALEGLKAMLGDPNHDQLLPVIQSQLNELTEQVRNQEVRFAEITRELGTCEHNLNGEIAQITATIPSTASNQLTSPRNPAEEASTSSSLSLRSEKVLILRKLEHFTNRSLNVMEHLRQTYSQPDSSRLIAHCEPWDDEIRHLTSALSTTAARVESIRNVGYVLTLENFHKIIQWDGWLTKFAEITVWHMRDTYFTLAVWKRFSECMTVDIEFNGVLLDSRCLPPIWRMRLREDDTVKDASFFLASRSTPCYCDRDEDTFVHFHLQFRIDVDSMKIDHLIRDGKMQFCIELDYE